MQQKFDSELVPQADSVGHLMIVIRAVGNGATTDEQIGLSFDATDRQGRYYRQAAVSIGLVKNSRNHATLTSSGAHFASSPNQNDVANLRAAALTNAAFRAFLAELSSNPTGWTRADVSNWIMNRTTTGGSTINRRVSSLWQWSVGLGYAYQEVGLLKPLKETIDSFSPTSSEPDQAGLPAQIATEVAGLRKKVSLPDYDPANEADGRTRTLQAMWQRQGQGTFRKQLLDCYNGRCAITLCDVSNALDAAHINSYRGPHTNHPQNGLLLRADIHNLFDLHLITIDVDKLTVLISPKLKGTVYESLAGTALSLPDDAELRPHTDALKAHRLKAGY